MALNPTQVSPQGQGGTVDKSAALSTSASYSGGGASTLIMVIGKSGRGKSTALENLPPERSFMVNVMGKPLPFMSSRLYSEGQNLFTSAEGTAIRRKMKEVSDSGKFDYLTIDDAQYIMATEFMDKALVKGYDKFTLMARNIWEILVLATKLRPTLKVFFLAHEEETASGERKMKTLGKLLDDKITPEGLATIVLYADVKGTKDDRQYFFSTQSDSFTNAKSPRGMFPPQIPNDLFLVAQRVDEYYEGIPLANSKLKSALEI
jgi:hypothetical protein